MKKCKKLLLGIVTLILSINVNAQSPAASGNNIIYGSNSKAGKYFDNRGFKMYYETYGKGEPLLIIHGNGGSIKEFTNQIPFNLIIKNIYLNRQGLVCDLRKRNKPL